MNDMSVNLPASLRNTVSVLRKADIAQRTSMERLASGLKVGSAIDGPPQFFTAKSLSQRAGDIDVLKQGIGQAISALKAAGTGADAVKGLLDQARGLTTTALANLDDSPNAIATRRSLAAQFDKILDQVEKVLGDAGYGGKNLLKSQRVTYGATNDSLTDVSGIDGIRKASVTNANGPDSYKIHVVGDGMLAGNAADLGAVRELFGLADIRLGGFNSRDHGNFGDVRFELHGTPGRDAKLVVLDGDESWTTSYTDAQLTALSDTGQFLDISHGFASGTRLNLKIDGKRMKEALQSSGLVTASVRRDIDLRIDVTDGRGITLTRSAFTQDGATRLRDGDNTFRFDSGTVRLDVDQSLIQTASTSEGSVSADLGNLGSAITLGAVTSIDEPDTDIHIEVARYGFGAGNVVLNQYVRPNKGTTTQGQIDASQTQVTLGGGMGAGQVLATINNSALQRLTSNATYLYNRSPGAGGLTTVADGNFSNGEFANPDVRRWLSSAQLTVTYGAVINGSRTVSVSDGLGGSFNGSIKDAGPTTSTPITLSGGVNNGATIGLFSKDGSAGTRLIDVHVGKDTYAVPDDATAASVTDFDALQGWSGFNSDSTVSISVGALNSGGAGQRTVTITQNDMGGGGSAMNNYTVANGATGNQSFQLSGGPNPGALVRFNVGASAGTYGYRVAAMNSTRTAAADITIRSPSLGQTATIRTEQIGEASDTNDLAVTLGPGGNRLAVQAVNIGTGAQGLNIDRAANRWHDRNDINRAIQDLNRADGRLLAAVSQVQVSTGLLNNRADFNSQFAQVLGDGAAKLVQGDQSADSANALTANVRAQLATTMLSLVVQSQQGILRLF